MVGGGIGMVETTTSMSRREDERTMTDSRTTPGTPCVVWDSLGIREVTMGDITSRGVEVGDVTSDGRGTC